LYYYLQRAGSAFSNVWPIVCLFVSEQDYMNSFQAVFMKPCRIMDYCCGTNLLNFGSDPTRSGRMAATLDFCYVEAWSA